MNMIFNQAVGALAVILAVALPGFASSSAAASTANPPAFAIYTLAESLDPRILAHGTGDWSRVTLSPTPVMSDADLLNYDFATHTMRVTPAALARLPRPPVSGTPFVAVAESELIYLGAFTTCESSMSFAVPSVMVDGRMFHTNQATNVLVVDRAYPTAQFGAGPDPRGDPRIRRALEKRVSTAAEVGDLPGLASNPMASAKLPAPAFAIYTLAESVDQRILARGTGDWSHVTLSPTPVISDADILNYDFATHTMRVTPEVLARLPRPPVSGRPFVVVADRERIYLGVFTTGLSSMSFALPSIMVDGRMIHTNQATDALVIDRAYPTAQFGAGPDPRGDPRIRRALEKRVSTAAELDVGDLSGKLNALLPKNWTLRHYLNAQPYGMEASFVSGVGFAFAGPSEVKGTKGEPTHETFTLVLVPDEFLGHPRGVTATDPGPGNLPAKVLGQVNKLKVFAESTTETPTWSSWQTDVKRALGIPLEPVSTTVSSHFQSLTVTTNDVVRLTRAGGGKAVVQFTSFGVKTASYRWRYWKPGATTAQEGAGAVYEKIGYDESPEALALPKHDCTVRAGDLNLEWSYGGTDQGYLYFYPSCERVQLLAAEAFDRVP
jgi:hypothetical protein